MKSLEQRLQPVSADSTPPLNCSKECGGCQWQEVLRERITDRHAAVRYRCGLCLSEHTRLCAFAGRETALESR
jgi:hypothetical protein